METNVFLIWLCLLGGALYLLEKTWILSRMASKGMTIEKRDDGDRCKGSSVADRGRTPKPATIGKQEVE